MHTRARTRTHTNTLIGSAQSLVYRARGAAFPLSEALHVSAHLVVERMQADLLIVFLAEAGR